MKKGVKINKNLLIGILIAVIILVIIVSVSSPKVREFFTVGEESEVLRGELATLAGGPAPSNVVAYYQFDGNLQDLTGNGHDGTANGVIPYTTGMVGEAAHFDGVSWVVVQDHGDLSIRDDMTFSAWVKFDQLPSVAGNPFGIINKNQEYFLETETNNEFSLAVADGTDLDPQAISSGINLQVDEWYHVVGVVDVAGGVNPVINKYLYINAVLVDSEETQAGQPSDTGSNLFIGNSAWTNLFMGDIDEVKIWNIALNQSQVIDEFIEYSCGNGICAGYGEDCSTCVADCGECTLTCGDGTCDAGESCNSCPGDCGDCIIETGSRLFDAHNAPPEWRDCPSGSCSFIPDGNCNPALSEECWCHKPPVEISQNIQEGNILTTSNIQGFVCGRIFPRPMYQCVDDPWWNCQAGGPSTQYLQVLCNADNSRTQIGFYNSSGNLIQQFSIKDFEAGIVAPPGTDTAYAYFIDERYESYFDNNAAWDCTFDYQIGQGSVDPILNPYLVAYYKFDSDALDYSGYGNDGILIGGAQIINGALVLDGIDDYVNVPDDNTLDIVEDMTYSAWVRFDELPSNTPWGLPILNKDTEYLLRGEADQDWFTFFVHNGSWWEPRAYSVDTRIQTGEWYYVVGVLDVEGSTINRHIYVNGELQNSQVNTGVITASANPLQIGTWFGTYFNGSIDEVKIWTKALTAGEIEDEYDNGIGRGLIAYYPFDNDAFDYSGNNHHGTLNGPIAVEGKINNAYDFDGIDDNVYVDSTSLLQLGPGQSVSAWVNLDQYNANWGRFVGKGEGVNRNYGLWVNNTGYPLFQIYNSDGSAACQAFGGGFLPLNEWSLVTGTYDGSTVKLYVGAELIATSITPCVVDPANDEDPLVIGRFPGAGNYINGSIDEVKIWDHALSEVEILQEYLRGEGIVSVTATNSTPTDGDPWYAVDDNDSTLWNSGSSDPDNLTIVYDSERTVVGYNITCMGVGGGINGTVYFYDSEGVLIGTSNFVECSDGNTVTVMLDDSINVQSVTIAGISNGDWVHINEFNLILSPLGDLIAYYKFDTDVEDYSGYENHGIMEGSLIEVGGVVNGAYFFDGNTNYVSLGNFDDMDGLNEFTIGFWIKPNQIPFTSPLPGIFSRGSNEQRVPWIYGDSDSTTIWFGTKTTSGTTHYTGVLDLVQDQWQYLVFTFNESYVQGYYNGDLKNTGNTDGNVVANTDGHNYIGYINGYDFLDGSLDEFKIWKRALTAQEIEDEYNNDLCEDSDGGLNYYVQGEACDQSICQQDVCLNTELTEYYCDEGLSSAILGINCSFGCTNGACNTDPVIICESYDQATCDSYDECFYDEESNSCYPLRLPCEDIIDLTDNVDILGMVYGYTAADPNSRVAVYDVCAGDFTNQVGCGIDDFVVYTPTNCPYGCTAGVCDTCVQTNGGVEICDGLDNDCDGTFDNGGNGLCDDGITCTDDVCNGVAGCSASENHANCQNGLFCDGDEICSIADSGCIAGTPINCNDGIDCSVDTCDEGADQTDNLGSCEVDTSPCDCTVDADCDDFNSCTDDVCNPDLTCEAVNDDTNTCDDGFWCTINDNCVAGSCISDPRVVDDSVGCTIDSCDEALDQIVNTPDDTICYDGLWCNGMESCDAILDCQVGTPMVCDDGLSCTVDSCDEEADITDNLGVCVVDSSSCECNVDADCDDNNPCTDDFCDIDFTCGAVNDDTNTCDDGEFCTENDNCVAGSCIGDVVDPDDSVSCTLDSCDEVNDIIVHTTDDSLCYDGLWCNGAETCDAINDCQAGVDEVCDDGIICTVDYCDEATPGDNAGSCEVDTIGCACTIDADCDDSNPCTDDFCDIDFTCGAVNDDTNTCDDGLWCTINDNCVAGSCISDPRVVDDSVGCTIDSCDEALDQIVNTPDDTICYDGNWCNGMESCDATLDCQIGTAPTCDDSVACTTDYCDEGTPGDNAGSCEVDTSPCDCVADADCEDNNPCTDDACVDLLCENTNNNANSCDDGFFCSVNDRCESGSCVSDPRDVDDGVGCTDDSCDEANDLIINAINHGNCDDGVVCTNDLCDAVSDCSNTAEDNLCELWETCDVVNDCQQSECINCEDCDNWFDPCSYDECHNSCTLEGACYYQGDILGVEDCIPLVDACTGITQCTDYSDEECVADPCNAGPVGGLGCEIDNNACVDAPYCGDDTCDAGEDYFTCFGDCAEPCVDNNDCLENEICFDDFCAPMTCDDNTDCDDGDDLTLDRCINPGTVDAECIYESIECQLDADCDDTFDCTVDSCVNFECSHVENDALCEIGEICNPPNFTTSTGCGVIIGCEDLDQDGLVEDTAFCPLGSDHCLGTNETFFINNPGEVANYEPIANVLNISTGINQFNIMNFENFIISSDEFGEIMFLDNISLVRINETGCFERINFDSTSVASISQGRIFLNSHFFNDFRTPAALKFFTIDFVEPLIFRGTQECSSLICNITNYIKGSIFEADITGFVAYEIKEGVGSVCGNGICETDLGEDCSNCNVDCEVCGSGGGGGGGGGGSTWLFREEFLKDCREKWICGEWSECEDNRQIRSCKDTGFCGSIVRKPDVVRECEPGKPLEPVSEEVLGIPDEEESNVGLWLLLAIILILILIIGYVLYSKYYKKTPEQRRQEKISNAKKIVEKSRAEGMTDDQIKESFKRKGWNEKDINEVFKSSVKPGKKPLK